MPRLALDMLVAFTAPGLQWVGFIKDYDGGTLMECVIVQRLPHTRLPAMLQAQKQALESCIRHYSKSHVVREGLRDFQQGARHVDIACIPGRASAAPVESIQF